jgi:hypothetical protein
VLAEFGEDVVAGDVGDLEVVALLLDLDECQLSRFPTLTDPRVTDQLGHSLAEALGVEGTPVDDNLDALLGDDIDGQLQTLPRSLLVASVLPLRIAFGVIGQVDLFKSPVSYRSEPLRRVSEADIPAR